MGKRLLMFALPVAVGVAVLVALIMTRDAPHQLALEERSTPVRTIDVPRVDMVPRARAYGTVQPGRSWDAVAEVGGKVVVTCEFCNSTLSFSDADLDRIKRS